MNRTLPLALAAFALLAACGGPMTIFYRPGAPVSRMQSDTLDCEVMAVNQAPVANQIRQNPPIYFPGNRYCNANGCYYTPGYWMDGGIYTVDVNASLRRRIIYACMAKKGYAPATLPRCSQQIASRVPKQQTLRLPSQVEGACVVRHNDGTWQIVPPQPGTASSAG